MTQQLGVGEHYGAVRRRFADLLGGLDEEQWSEPVPACPGWDVHDVLAHLVGTIEDANAGELTGPPDDAQTAAQVARHRASPPAELLASWDALAPGFEAGLSALRIWPGFFDVLSHEHDVRGALGIEGERASDEVELAAKLLIRGVDLGRPFRVETATAVLSSAVYGDATDVDATDGDAADGDAALTLRATSFDVFRLRLGRRTRDQVLAMDWSEDPADVVDSLFAFGPTAVVVEPV